MDTRWLGLPSQNISNWVAYDNIYVLKVWRLEVSDGGAVQFFPCESSLHSLGTAPLHVLTRPFLGWQTLSFPLTSSSCKDIHPPGPAPFTVLMTTLVLLQSHPQANQGLGLQCIDLGETAHDTLELLGFFLSQLRIIVKGPSVSIVPMGP